MKRSERAYSVGDAVGGVTVLAVLVGEGCKRERWYRVRHACCGKEVDMREWSIDQRVRRDAERCRACSRAHRAQMMRKRGEVFPPAPVAPDGPVHYPGWGCPITGPMGR